MKLTQGQIKIIKAIKKGIEKGDINAIAKNTCFTRVYVSMVLSKKNESYNEQIITEAIKIIGQREKKRKLVLDTLPV